MNRKFSSIVLILGLMLLLSMTQAFAEDANLIIDPGFESMDLVNSWCPAFGVTDNWVYQATGYGTYSGGAYLKLMHPNYCSSMGLPVLTNSGSGSMNILNSFNPPVYGPLEVSVYQDFAAVGSSNYAATIWVKTTGFIANDVARLVVREFDAQHNQIGADRVAAVTATTSGFQQLSILFQANSNTKVVRFLLYGKLNAGYYDDNYGLSPTVDMITWDDASLTGPAGLALPSLSGQVKHGSTAIANAKVELLGTSYSTQTDANGHWELNPSVGKYTVRASINGYYAQRKVDVNAELGAAPLNFNLTATGSNLFRNAGCDDIWNSGGWVSTTGAVSAVAGSSLASQGAPTAFRSGWESATLILSGTMPAEGKVYQRIPVVPNGTYTARTWFKPAINSEYGSLWGDSAGNQAALFVQEYDAAGNPIGDEQRVYATESNISSWEELAITNFQVSSETTELRVGGYAYMEDIYIDFLTSANFDDFELTGQAGQAGISGKITCAGEPVASAAVQIADIAAGSAATTILTDNNGNYSYPSAQYGHTYKIDISRTGFRNETKTVFADVTQKVDFDLTPLGVNLLANPGFETPMGMLMGHGSDSAVNNYSWWWGWGPAEALSYEYVTYTPNNYLANAGIPGLYVRTGNYGVFQMSEPQFAQMTIWQDIDAKAGDDFAAAVYVRPTGKFGQGTDAATIILQTLDADKNVLSEKSAVTNVKSDDFQKLSARISSADIGTNYIRFKLMGTLDPAGSIGYDHTYVDGTGIVWDDCLLLNVASGISKMSGTVRNGASAISGATVTLTDTSATPATVQTVTTGADGTYLFSVFSTHIYKVEASKAGFETDTQTVNVSGNVVIDLDLIASGGGTNLLLNPGFETPMGWVIGQGSTPPANAYDWTWGFGPAAAISNTYSITSPNGYLSGAGVSGPYVKEGNSAVFQMTEPQNATMSIWQNITAGAGEDYSAVAWVKPTGLFGNATDEARLFLQALDSTGTVLADKTGAVLSASTDFKRLHARIAPTPAGTASIRFKIQSIQDRSGMTGNQHTYVDGTGIIWDDCNLQKVISLTPMKLSDIKKMPEDSPVYLTGMVVTAAFDGFFYIEEQDRSTGIKVTGTAIAGEIVTVSGAIKTINGEKTIISTSVSGIPGGTIPRPIGMNNRAAQADVIATGLYTVTFGSVQNINSANGTFTVTDGAGQPIKVYKPFGYTPVANDYVRITGALGMEGSPATRVVYATSVTKVN